MKIVDLKPNARVIVLALLVGTASWPLAAKVFLTQEEALKLAFPGGAVERRTAFLTKDQQREAQKLSGGDVLPGALVAYYVGTTDGRVLGTAYFDTHVVRTMTETIMVVVDPRGAVARIEVLSFSEPEEYLPRPHWYSQFAGKALNDELSMKRGIRPVAGATLTARATTEAARRVLALDQVIHRGVAARPTSTPARPAGGSR
ncbi:MAG TPA: FMN-binding protein [Thermoanaerobaculia bacterium]